MEVKFWFIDGFYTIAGRPKLEAWVMGVARDQYLDRLIREEDLPKFVAHLTRIMEMAWEENKRQKKVEISLSGTSSHDNTQWLYIGEQRLTLRRVVGYITP